MENRVKILIADGNEEFCDHVKRRLEQVPGYEIVGTAADGQRALELMRVTKPDILVLDLMLSKLDGIAVLKRAREDGQSAGSAGADGLYDGICRQHGGEPRRAVLHDKAV